MWYNLTLTSSKKESIAGWNDKKTPESMIYWLSCEGDNYIDLYRKSGESHTVTSFGISGATRVPEPMIMVSWLIKKTIILLDSDSDIRHVASCGSSLFLASS